MPWGFYWSDEATHTNAESNYFNWFSGPHYYLLEGAPPFNIIGAHLLGKVIDGAGVLQGATNEIKTQIENYADWTRDNVTILATNTYTMAADITDYVTDIADHVVHNGFGFLTLEHSSSAVLSMPVSIPTGANALAFGVEFLYGESSSMLEVFVDDVLVYHTTSDRALREGLQLIPWINVESFAGQSTVLKLRISNPNPDTEGKIRIDDLVIAKIENAKVKFPWFMFLPAITR